MAYRLKNRNMQMPNGYTYLQPETKWRPSRFPSFDMLVQQVIAHRKGNPALAAKYSTDARSVADELDAYCAAICAKNGWVNFIVSEDGLLPPPKSEALLSEQQKHVAAAAGRVKKIWAGVRTLDDWLDSDEPPVAQDLSEKRAGICAACPLNGQGDFTKWFTKPAAEAIKRQLERVQEAKLETSFDDKIVVCEACLCPLKLKVHTPIKYIKAHLSPEVQEELKKGKDCWILAELK